MLNPIVEAFRAHLAAKAKKPIQYVTQHAHCGHYATVADTRWEANAITSALHSLGWWGWRTRTVPGDVVVKVKQSCETCEPALDHLRGRPHKNLVPR